MRGDLIESHKILRKLYGESSELIFCPEWGVRKKGSESQNSESFGQTHFFKSKDANHSHCHPAQLRGCSCCCVRSMETKGVKGICS